MTDAGLIEAAQWIAAAILAHAVLGMPSTSGIESALRDIARAIKEFQGGKAA